MPARTIRTNKQPGQGALPFKSRGGSREGAGRKPNGPKPGAPHLVRARVASRFPVHVTTRLRKGLPGLRRARTYRALLRAFFLGCQKDGFRLVHYSVQGNHLHLIVEARDRTALSRGVQGLLIRVARTLNKLWQRKGKVFADRYHDVILATPRYVRNALRYVLNNARKHGQAPPHEVDVFTSGAWFDGWRENLEVRNAPADAPVVRPRTWLLTTGWRRHGLLSASELPRAG